MFSLTYHKIPLNCFLDGQDLLSEYVNMMVPLCLCANKPNEKYKSFIVQSDH
jgi:hypothetical protein